MIRSVKHRLALGYGLVLTCLFGIAFVLIQRDLEKHLIYLTDSHILEKARRNNWYDQNLPHEKIQASFDKSQIVEGAHQVFYRLYDQNGVVLAQSDAGVWSDLQLDTDLICKLGQTVNIKGKKEIFKLAGDMRVRFPRGKGYAKLKNVPAFVFLESGRLPKFPYRIGYIPMGGGKVLICAQNTLWDGRFLQRFRKSYLIFFLVSLGLGSGLGYLLSAKAMGGVKRVTHTARDISQGDMTRRVSVGRAGTEIETLAQTFNTMLDRIQALLSSLKQVTDDIAHDLRTPITRIRSSAELLATTAKDPDCANQMGQIVEECDRLVEMINTMLEIAQTDAGAQALERECLDLGEIIRQGFELCQTMAEDKGLQYGLQIPEVSLTVMGNEARLQRALTNLLDNAIKFTPAGQSVCLGVTQQNQHIHIHIKDTGIGIPPAEHQRIFDRFYRRDPSRNIAGNGLGLCLARSIVHAHGGQIYLESEEGKGSCFTIELPMTT